MGNLKINIHNVTVEFSTKFHFRENKKDIPLSDWFCIHRYASTS